jgi:prepilin-type N-terminal cleavage/methylation domain-containing protein
MVIESKFNGSKKQQGFGLLEVMVAAIILGITIVALSKFQVDNRKSMIQTKNRNEAMIIAQDFLDSLQQMGLANIQNGIQDTLEVNRRSGFGRIFSVASTITTHETIVQSGLPISKKVEVKVNWPSARGNNRIESLQMEAVIE